MQALILDIDYKDGVLIEEDGKKYYLYLGIDWRHYHGFPNARGPNTAEHDALIDFVLGEWEDYKENNFIEPLEV